MTPSDIRSPPGGGASFSPAYLSIPDAQVLTSERTLSRLTTPRLSQDEVSRLLSGMRNRYRPEIQALVLENKVAPS
jgi:hypothetical protein